jgi:hypothetical protein
MRLFKTALAAISLVAVAFLPAPTALPAQPVPLGSAASVKTDLSGEWRDTARRPLAPAAALAGVPHDFSPSAATPAVPIAAGAGPAPIAIGRKVTRIHFLHTFEPGPDTLAWQRAETAAKEKGDNVPDLPTLFTYRIHLAAGGRIDFPVRWDESIHGRTRDDFWDPLFGMTGDLPLAPIAALSPLPGEPGKVRALYTLSWPNPAPDREVLSVEILPPASPGAGSGHLLAITTDDKPSPGRLLFASPAASSPGDGSFGRPFADLHQAIDQLQPGDTLYLRGGRYLPTRRLLLTRSGAEGRPITLSAYPGETAIIDASRYTFSADPTLKSLRKSPFETRIGFVQIDRQSDWVIRNLRFENMISMGVFANEVTRTDILHNHFFLSPASAIFLTGHHSRANHNTVIRACSLEAFRRHFAHDPARDTDPVLVAHREFLDNRKRRGGFGDECIDVGGTGSTHLEGSFNEVCWGDKEGFDTKGGPEHVKVLHNYIHRNQFWTGLYIDGWTAPLRHVEVAYNVVAHNWGSGIAVNVEFGPLVENVHVHHNLSFNNDLAGIDIGRAGKDGPRRALIIEHNTVVNNGHAQRNRNPAGGINLGSPNVEDIIIRNNLVLDNRDYGLAVFGPAADRAGKNIVLTHNLLWPRPENGWIRDSKNFYADSGENPVFADPRLVDPAKGDFRLRTDSPARGAGTGGADLGAFPYRP